MTHPPEIEHQHKEVSSGEICVVVRKEARILVSHVSVMPQIDEGTFFATKVPNAKSK